MLPTIAPSHSPTVSPSFAPTFSALDRWVSTVNLDNIAIANQSYFQSIYSELLVDASFQSAYYGGCSKWKSFVYSSLLSYRSRYQLQRWSLFVDLDIAGSLPSVVSCSNKTSGLAIVDALLSSSASLVQVQCDGNRWTTKTCPTTGIPALCLNCADPCSVTDCTSIGGYAYFNPCSAEVAACAPSSYAHWLSADFQSELILIPSVSSSQLYSTRTSVSLALSLSTNGTADCGIFAGNSTVPSTLSAIIVQNVGTSFPASTMNVTFTGLLPSSLYTIYCNMQGVDGSMQTLEQTVARSYSKSTSCCRTVTLTIIPTAVLQNQPSADAIMIESELAAGDDVSIALSLNNSGNITAVFPTEIKLQAAGIAFASLTRSNTQYAGNSTVLAVMTGSQAELYSIVFHGQPSLRIAAVVQSLPAPLPIRAIFTADGLRIVISFDAATDRGGLSAVKFSCSALLSASTAIASSCGWINDTALLMTLPVKSNIIPASNLTVLANKIRAKCIGDCSAFPYAALTNVTVQAPAIKTAPKAVLLSSGLHSFCNALDLDFSSSSGSGNRDWSQIVFRVYNGNATLSTVAIEQYLQSTSWPLGIASIPASYLFPGTWTISLTLCNFLDACGRTSKTVVLTSFLLPTVSILADSTSQISSKATLKLKADAFTQNCGGSINRQQLQYTWTVTIASTAAVVQVTSTSARKSVFSIPAVSLQSAVWYSISLSVLYTVSNRVNSAVVSVYVQPASIIALINGGSAINQQVGSNYTIDASSSFDEGATSTALLFAWSCSQLLPDFSSSCPFQASAISSQSRWSVVLPLSAANATGRMTVNVGSADGRNATAFVDIHAVDSSAASVQLNHAGSSVINAGDKVKISASVSATTWSSMAWSINDSSVSLAAISLTPISVLSTTGQTNVSIQNLVLQQYALPAGGSYLLTLSVFRTALIGSASVVITTNSNPSPGSFTVAPGIGVELVHTFVFSALFWSDADLPLTFAFGFYSTADQFQRLTAASESASGAYLLPRGSQTQGNASNVLTAVLYVYDALQGRSSASQAVVVAENANQTTADIANYIASVFKSNSSDEDDYYAALSTASQTMNLVSCAAAPNCSQLHREECADVANTCGLCLDGFLGEEAAANTPCFQTSRRRLAAAASVTCQLVSKQCPSNCSAHGSCGYFNKYSLTAVPVCHAVDVDCIAKCACDADYTDSDCSSSSDAMAVRIATRLSMIDKLYNLTASTDSSSDSVVEWINSLIAITAVQAELNASSIWIARDVIGQVFLQMGSGLTYEDIQPILTPINQIMAFLTSSSSSLSSASSQQLLQDMESYLLQYVAVVFGDMSVSEQAVNVRQDMFQVEVYAESITRDLLVSLALQASDLEEYIALQMPSVTVRTEQTSSAADSLQASILSLEMQGYGNSSGNSSSLSKPLFFQLAQAQSVCAGGCQVNLTVSNLQMTSYRQPSALVYHLVDCQEHRPHGSSADAWNVSIACPQDLTLLVHCNASSSLHQQRVNASCPYFHDYPTCQSIGQSSSGQCLPVSYDGNQTVCQCHVLPSASSSSRRRRLAGRRRLQSTGDTYTAGMIVQKVSEYHPSVFVSMPAKDDKQQLTQLQWLLMVIVPSALVCLVCLFAAYLLRDRDKELLIKIMPKHKKRSKASSLPGQLALLQGLPSALSDIRAMKEANDYYRQQLDIPFLTFTVTLRRLLESRPLDLPMCSKLKAMLLAENDQLLVWSQVHQGERFMTEEEALSYSAMKTSPAFQAVLQSLLTGAVLDRMLDLPMDLSLPEEPEDEQEEDAGSDEEHRWAWDGQEVHEPVMPMPSDPMHKDELLLVPERSNPLRAAAPQYLIPVGGRRATKAMASLAAADAAVDADAVAEDAEEALSIAESLPSKRKGVRFAEEDEDEEPAAAESTDEERDAQLAPASDAVAMDEMPAEEAALPSPSAMPIAEPASDVVPHSPVEAQAEDSIPMEMPFREMLIKTMANSNLHVQLPVQGPEPVPALVKPAKEAEQVKAAVPAAVVEQEQEKEHAVLLAGNFARRTSIAKVFANDSSPPPAAVSQQAEPAALPPTPPVLEAVQSPTVPAAASTFTFSPRRPSVSVSPTADGSAAVKRPSLGMAPPRPAVMMPVSVSVQSPRPKLAVPISYPAPPPPPAAAPRPVLLVGGIPSALPVGAPRPRPRLSIALTPTEAMASFGATPRGLTPRGSLPLPSSSPPGRPMPMSFQPRPRPMLSSPIASAEPGAAAAVPPRGPSQVLAPAPPAGVLSPRPRLSMAPAAGAPPPSPPRGLMPRATVLPAAAGRGPPPPMMPAPQPMMMMQPRPRLMPVQGAPADGAPMAVPTGLPVVRRPSLAVGAVSPMAMAPRPRPMAAPHGPELLAQPRPAMQMQMQPRPMVAQMPTPAPVPAVAAVVLPRRQSLVVAPVAAAVPPPPPPAPRPAAPMAPRPRPIIAPGAGTSPRAPPPPAVLPSSTGRGAPRAPRPVQR